MRSRLSPVMIVVTVVSVLSAARCYGQSITARDVFRNYVTASGGETAIRAVTTRWIKGEVVTPGGKAPLQIIQAAPDRFLRVIDSPVSGHSENGFDGTTAWTKNSGGVREISGPQAGMVTRELHLYRALVIAEFYSSVAEPRADTLDGRPVYTIVATTKDGMRETLYFDRESGLLSAWDVAIGETTIRSSLQDYRTVNGVMIAFRLKRSRPDFSWVEEFNSVQQNVALDTLRFSKPQP